jgi:hypothetical protein
MWNGIVNSRYLFQVIVKSIGEVASENTTLLTQKPKPKISEKVVQRNQRNTKFARRFNMGGSGLAKGPSSQTPMKSKATSNLKQLTQSSSANDIETKGSKLQRVGTPSTTTHTASSGDNHMQPS